jgi:hypothetical protein
MHEVTALDFTFAVGKVAVRLSYCGIVLNCASEYSVQSLQPLLAIENKGLFSTSSGERHVIERRKIRVGIDHGHELAGSNLFLGPPKKKRLDWVFSHQAVEEPGHLIAVPYEGPLNVGQHETVSVDIFKKPEQRTGRVAHGVPSDWGSLWCRVTVELALVVLGA